MSMLLPPEGLSGDELVEWAEEQNLRDQPREFALPEMSGVDAAEAVNLGFIHVVFPPEIGVATDDYMALWKYLWFACTDKDRPVDEAMLLDDNCPRCKQEWDRRGLPVANLPKITLSSPVLRGPTKTVS